MSRQPSWSVEVGHNGAECLAAEFTRINFPDNTGSACCVEDCVRNWHQTGETDLCGCGGGRIAENERNLSLAKAGWKRWIDAWDADPDWEYSGCGYSYRAPEDVRHKWGYRMKIT